MASTFSQFSETDRLQKVILGRYKGYRRVREYEERVNKKQQKGLPRVSQLKREFEAFSQVLADHNVEVLTPDYVGKFVYDQLTPRDLGVTVGDKFVICNMARSSRRYEAAGIFRHILAMDGEEPNILLPPDHTMLLEGGDILVDNKRIFVGLTRRTNRAGYEFLRSAFHSRFEVLPIPCQSFDAEERILHLDCVFNPVGADHALIYPPGLQALPNAITDNYRLIEIDKAAQRALAANVLSLSREVVISRDHPDCRAANAAMREAGLKVIELPFDGAPATGGSFRCCTLPLVRS